MTFMLPAGWLFPGQDSAKPITTRQLSRVVEAAAEAAGLTKIVRAVTSPLDRPRKSAPRP